MGDDPKLLDWKIFGRTDRLVTKTYQDESNIGATVVLDTSASMGFSYAGRVSKLDYAKTLAAALSYLLISQSDAVGLVSEQKKIPMSRGRSSTELFFQQVSELKAQGVVTLEALVKMGVAHLKRKQLILVFSDLMNDPEKIKKLCVSYGYEIKNVTLGEEGVRLEKK
jgi:uncharacterized protein (DUF58 family)